MSVMCPYCNADAVLTDSAEVYGGRSYGTIWLCRPCEAWVGCHKRTNVPMGRLANQELRGAKILAHAAFDPRWQRFPQKKGFRREQYAWLARQLGIPVDECHIGMFDIAMCRRVVEICIASTDSLTENLTPKTEATEKAVLA